MIKNKEPNKPFIKWLGGKAGLIAQLKNNLPDKFNNYHEPFVGGGALFFNLKPKNAFLSDINEELILTYLTIKDNLEELLKKLEYHQKNHCKEYYYKVRSNQFPKSALDVASRFIYLNKTCFNGLYRVNKKGEFNSPMANYKKPNIYDKDNLIKCRKYLIETKSIIKKQSFEKINPKKSDFVYLDPPYHKTYSGYSTDIFGEDKQIELRDFCDYLNNKGVFFMLSNSNTEFINNLYKDYNINKITAPRNFNFKGKKTFKEKELIVTNYINTK